jgi:hypothetical protein
MTMSEQQDQPAAEPPQTGGDADLKPPPAEARPRERSSAKPWLIGCGIGCAVLLLIAVVGAVMLAMGGVALYREVSEEVGQTFEEARPNALDAARETVDSLAAEGEIGAEHEQAYRELLEIADDESVSGTGAIVALTPILMPEDSQRGPGNLAEARAIAEFVEGHRDLGMFGLAQLPPEHQSVMARFQRVLEAHAPGHDFEFQGQAPGAEQKPVPPSEAGPQPAPVEAPNGG